MLLLILRIVKTVQTDICFTFNFVLIDILIWRFDYHRHFQLQPLGEVNNGVLTVYTTAGDDRIDIHETQDGQVLIDVGGDSQRFSNVKEVYVAGGGGNDRIYVAESFNRRVRALGGAGRDVLISDSDAEIYFDGGSGDDELIQLGSSGAVLRGGSGDDIIIGGIGDDSIFGDAGDDRIYGDEAESLYSGVDAAGFGGSDVISGGSGADVIFGQYGDDNISGDSGVDILYGQEGRDVLRGGTDDDQLFGGVDDDELRGEGGNDQLEGEEGNDRVYGGSGADQIYWTVGLGMDEIYGGDGRDQLNAFAREFAGGSLASDFVEIAVKAGTNTSRVYWQEQRMSILDLTEIEVFDASLGGGQDELTLNESSQGVDLKVVSANLGANDGFNDLVRLVGSDDKDDGISGRSSQGDVANFFVHSNANVLRKSTGAQTLQVNQAKDGDRIEILTGDGADHVDLSQIRIPAVSASSLLRHIDTGAGNDRIVGSANQDFIVSGIGDDWISGGEGQDVYIDQGGRDTFVYDADFLDARQQSVTFEVDGNQLVVKHSDAGATVRSVETEDLRGFDDWQLLGTQSNDRFDFREFTAAATVDGREGSDTYLNRANSGVTRFGVENDAANLLTLEDDLSATLGDGNLVVGLDLMTIQLAAATAASALVPTVTVVRGLQSGVYATVQAFSSKTYELVVSDLTGVPVVGEQFEVVGTAHPNPEELNFSVAHIGSATTPVSWDRDSDNTLPEVGELLTGTGALLVVTSVDSQLGTFAARLIEGNASEEASWFSGSATSYKVTTKVGTSAAPGTGIELDATGLTAGLYTGDNGRTWIRVEGVIGDVAAAKLLLGQWYEGLDLTPAAGVSGSAITSTAAAPVLATASITLEVRASASTPVAGDYLTSATYPEVLLRVDSVSTSGDVHTVDVSVVKGTLTLDKTDDLLPASDQQGGQFALLALGDSLVNDALGDYYLAKLTESIVAGTSSRALVADVVGAPDADGNATVPTDGFYFNGDAVVSVTSGVGTWWSGVLTDGMTLQNSANETLTLKAASGATTLTGAITAEIKSNYDFNVAVENDFSADTENGPLEQLIAKLDSEGVQTLYRVRGSSVVAVEIEWADATLGQIRLSSGSASIEQGDLLYDLALDGNGDPVIDVTLLDAPVFVVGRAMADAANRALFEVQEGAMLGQSATNRVFDRLATLLANTDEPVLLYTADGRAVKVTAADATTGRVQFDLAVENGARLLATDLALYENVTDRSIADRPVLRLIGQANSAAIEATVARTIDYDLNASKLDLDAASLDTLRISGLAQPFYEGQRVAVLSGSGLEISRVAETSLDASRLHVKLTDSGSQATTVLAGVDGLAEMGSADVALVMGTDIAVVKTPAGFEGNFLENEVVYRVEDDSTQTEVGTVRIYKAGAGELHIDMKAGVYLDFGDRLYSQYTASGADAHSGKLVVDLSNPLSLMNKRLLLKDVARSTIGAAGILTGDSLRSESGRELVDVGYLGEALDSNGNALNDGNYDLILNQLRLSSRPFEPASTLYLVNFDGTTWTNIQQNGTEANYLVGSGALDVDFGPDGWEILLSSATQTNLDNFDSALPNDWQRSLTDRTGLYLSTSPVNGAGEPGIDVGRLMGWDRATGKAIVEVLDVDRDEATLAPGSKLYLREAPVSRLPDVNLSGAISRSGTTLTLDLSVDVALTDIEDMTHLMVMSGDNVQIAAVIDWDATRATFATVDQKVIAKIASADTSVVLPSGNQSGDSGVFKVTEGFENRGMVTSVVAGTEAGTGVITLANDDATFIEHDSNNQAKFAQLVALTTDSIARAQVKSVELVNGQYKLTVAYGFGHTLTSLKSALEGELLRITTAERLPVYTMGNMSVDYAVKVNMTELDWTLNTYVQTVTLDTSAHGLIAGDSLTLVAPAAMNELSGSIVGVVKSINGAEVELELRRGQDIFENVSTVEMIRQGDQVGQTSWDLSQAELIADKSTYNIEVETGQTVDIWKVRLAYSPTAEEQAIFDSEADGLDAGEILLKESFILPYRPLVNDRLTFRDYFQGLDGAAYTRASDTATVLDVQEVKDSDGNIIAYNTFVEVRYSDLQDPEIIAASGFGLSDGTSTFDIVSAATVNEEEVLLSSTEFDARRVAGLENVDPRPFYADQPFEFTVGGQKVIGKVSDWNSEIQQITLANVRLESGVSDYNTRVSDLFADGATLTSDIDVSGSMVVGDRFLVEVDMTGKTAPRIGTMLRTDAGVELGRIVSVDGGVFEVVVNLEALETLYLESTPAATVRWTPETGTTEQVSTVVTTTTNLVVAFKVSTLAREVEKPESAVSPVSGDKVFNGGTAIGEVVAYDPDKGEVTLLLLEAQKANLWFGDSVTYGTTGTENAAFVHELRLGSLRYLATGYAEKSAQNSSELSLQGLALDFAGMSKALFVTSLDFSNDGSVIDFTGAEFKNQDQLVTGVDHLDDVSTTWEGHRAYSPGEIDTRKHVTIIDKAQIQTAVSAGDVQVLQKGELVSIQQLVKQGYLGYSDIEQLFAHGTEGEDSITLNNTSALTNVYGHGGKDSIFIGTVIEARQVPNPDGSAGTVTVVETTPGTSDDTRLFGGTGNDYFQVYRNKGETWLFGDAGDDTFFIKATLGLNNLGSGKGKNKVGYNKNAPLHIDGGSGFDTVILEGTEIGDRFVVYVDDEGVQQIKGAGIDLKSINNVEKIQINAIDGEDMIYIYGIAKETQLTVNTGRGSDTIQVGGQALVFDPISQGIQLDTTAPAAMVPKIVYKEVEELVPGYTRIEAIPQADGSTLYKSVVVPAYTVIKKVATVSLVPATASTQTERKALSIDAVKIGAQNDLSAFDNIVIIDGSSGADQVQFNLFGNKDGSRANGVFETTTDRDILIRTLKSIYGESYEPTDAQLMPVDSPDNATYGWVHGFGSSKQGVVLDNNELVRIQLGNAANQVIVNGVDEDIINAVISLGGGDDTVTVGSTRVIGDVDSLDADGDDTVQGLVGNLDAIKSRVLLVAGTGTDSVNVYNNDRDNALQTDIEVVNLKPFNPADPTDVAPAIALDDPTKVKIDFLQISMRDLLDPDAVSSVIGLNGFLTNRIYLGAGDDNIDIQSANLPFELFAGAGNDNFFVGSNPLDALNSDLDGITTTVRLDGGSGSSRLVVSRAGDSDASEDVEIGHNYVRVQHRVGSTVDNIVSTVVYNARAGAGEKKDEIEGFNRGVTVYTGKGDDKNVKLQSMRNDTIYRVYLGDGDDAMRAFAPMTVASGPLPHDLLRVYGGAGNDLIDMSMAEVNVRLFGGDGDDTLRGSSGFDIILGEAGDDLIEGFGSSATGTGLWGEQLEVLAGDFVGRFVNRESSDFDSRYMEAYGQYFFDRSDEAGNNGQAFSGFVDQYGVLLPAYRNPDVNAQWYSFSTEASQLNVGGRDRIFTGNANQTLDGLGFDVTGFGIDLENLTDAQQQIAATEIGETWAAGWFTSYQNGTRSLTEAQVRAVMAAKVQERAQAGALTVVQEELAANAVSDTWSANWLTDYIDSNTVLNAAQLTAILDAAIAAKDARLTGTAVVIGGAESDRIVAGDQYAGHEHGHILIGDEATLTLNQADGTDVFTITDQFKRVDRDDMLRAGDDWISYGEANVTVLAGYGNDAIEGGINWRSYLPSTVDSLSWVTDPEGVFQHRIMTDPSTLELTTDLSRIQEMESTQGRAGGHDTVMIDVGHLDWIGGAGDDRLWMGYEGRLDTLLGYDITASTDGSQLRDFRLNQAFDLLEGRSLINDWTWSPELTLTQATVPADLMLVGGPKVNLLADYGEIVLDQNRDYSTQIWTDLTRPDNVEAFDNIDVQLVRSLITSSDFSRVNWTLASDGGDDQVKLVAGRGDVILGEGDDSFMSGDLTNASGNEEQGLVVLGDTGYVDRRVDNDRLTRVLFSADSTSVYVAADDKTVMDPQLYRGGDDQISVGEGNHVLMGGAGSDSVSAAENVSDLTKDLVNFVAGDTASMFFDPRALAGDRTLVRMFSGENSDPDALVASNTADNHVLLATPDYDDYVATGAGRSVLVGGYGSDEIVSGTGKHYLFGDLVAALHTVEQVPSTLSAEMLRLENSDVFGLDTQRYLSIRGTLDLPGGNDIILSSTNDAIVFGGGGDDIMNLQGGDPSGTTEGQVVAIGDSGQAWYMIDQLGNDYGSSVVDLFDSFELHYVSTEDVEDKNPTDSPKDAWGDDQIITNNGRKILLGGGGADTIMSGDGDEIIFGDGGRILLDPNAKTEPWSIAWLSSSDKFGSGNDRTVRLVGGDDQILTGGGDKVIVGGIANDTIKVDQVVTVNLDIDGRLTGFTAQTDLQANDSDRLLLAGDNIEAQATIDVAGNPWTSVFTLDELAIDAGVDSVLAGNYAELLALGGGGSDTIRGYDGEAYVLADLGQMRWDAANQHRLLQIQSTTGDWVDADVWQTLGGDDQVMLGYGSQLLVAAGRGDDRVWTSVATSQGDSPTERALHTNDGLATTQTFVSGDHAVFDFDTEQSSLSLSRLSTVAPSITGSDGDDEVRVGGGKSWVVGGGADDVITSGDGITIGLADYGQIDMESATGRLDQIEANEQFVGDLSLSGNDYIAAGMGSQYLFGGAGDDVIRNAEDTVDRNSSTYQLATWSSANNRDQQGTYAVAFGDDGLADFDQDNASNHVLTLTDTSVTYGSGDDRIDLAGAVNGQWVLLGGGDDVLNAGDGQIVVLGDRGLVKQAANGHLSSAEVKGVGDAGDDQITIAAGESVIFGGAGADDVRTGINGGDTGSDFVWGDTGQVLLDSTLTQFLNPTWMESFGLQGQGNDTIVTAGGADRVLGGGGADRIVGGGNRDVLAGDYAQLKLDGERFLTLETSELLQLQGAGDYIVSGYDGDFVFGGAGNNIFDVAAGVDMVFETYGFVELVQGEGLDKVVKFYDYGVQGGVLTKRVKEAYTEGRDDVDILGVKDDLIGTANADEALVAGEGSRDVSADISSLGLRGVDYEDAGKLVNRRQAVARFLESQPNAESESPQTSAPIADQLLDEQAKLDETYDLLDVLTPTDDTQSKFSLLLTETQRQAMENKRQLVAAQSRYWDGEKFRELI